MSPADTRSGPLKSVSSVVGSQEAGTPEHATSIASETSSRSLPSHPQQETVSNQPQSTESRSMSDPCYIIVEFMGEAGEEIAECFRTASEFPPITTESLAELDMNRIINNPKLRHDCNFDRELHFRPNLDGPKGKQKIKLAEDYWKALEGELFVYGIVHQKRRDAQDTQSEKHWWAVLCACQKRLPQVFHTIRDILKSLVPDRDQKAILERLDVELIMQEILNGMCDLIDLGNWLAKVLKNHCAPMRDGMVDEMQAEIRQGAADEKPHRLVNGIRQLLNILEAMKLDVANHQIRHMRPMLVDDTINFHRKYNTHRIAVRKIDVGKGYLWLEDEINAIWCEGYNTTRLGALSSALLKSIIFEQEKQEFPPTFYLDFERLRTLRTEFHTMIYHQICRDILFDVVGRNAPADAMARASSSLYHSLVAIIGHNGRFMDRMDNIAAEIMRIALLVEQNDTAFDETLLDFIEGQLIVEFHNESSSFSRHSSQLLARLTPKLKTSVAKHARLGAVQLQDALLAPPVPTTSHNPFGFGAVLAPVRYNADPDPDDDPIRRLTHMIVLHWQVFADLIYDNDSTGPVPGPGIGSPEQSSGSAASASPMQPVAQAVYGPGKQWLPMAVTVTEVPTGLPTPAPSPSPTQDTQKSEDLEHDDTASPEDTQSDDAKKRSAS